MARDSSIQAHWQRASPCYSSRRYKKKTTPEIVQVISNEITKRSPALMGWSRGPLLADSVGETLALRHNETPPVMSYVLPLLVEEGFCTVSDRKPFVIHRQ